MNIGQFLWNLKPLKFKKTHTQANKPVLDRDKNYTDSFMSSFLPAKTKSEKKIKASHQTSPCLKIGY